MAASFTIRIDDQITPGIARLVSSLSGNNRQALHQIGGRAAMEGARDYHRQYDESGGLFNPSAPTWGAGRKRTYFGRDIVRAWGEGPATASGVTIINNDERLNLKVFGGTVKHPKALTIPIDPRAHGRSVAQFERVVGVKVFRPRGKSVLMFVERSGGSAKVAYVLRKSVTFSKWKGAAPSEESIVGPYVEAISAELNKALK